VNGSSDAREGKAGGGVFRGRKHLAVLDRPVESSGELSFVPPHTLEKRTLSPRPERVVIDRERLTIERGGKTYSMGLLENPAVAVLVESIRSTLAGDLASLTRTYSAGLEGDAAAWRLKLRPLDPSLATLVERVEIAGSHAQVRRVEIFQADGDRSVMSLAPAPPDGAPPPRHRRLARGLASPLGRCRHAFVRDLSLPPLQPDAGSIACWWTAARRRRLAIVLIAIEGVDAATPRPPFAGARRRLAGGRPINLRGQTAPGQLRQQPRCWPPSATC